MDKLKDKIKNEEKSKSGVLKQFFASLKAARDDVGEGARLIILLAVGVIFSRCHLIFGAHPLGIALISALPHGVWAATAGAVAGALTLGKAGMIYAMISLIAVFIRVIISGGTRRDDGSVFSENLLLRMSAATVAGFIAAVYEFLLSGFSEASVLFGVSMILIPPIICFILSGLFNTGIDIKEIFSSDKCIFSFEGKGENERYNIVFFSISALISLFLITLSLLKYDLFGICAGYIFSSFATLVAAKRFGALRAMAVGFVSSLPTGALSVSFALAGLGSGLLFSYGAYYAFAVGGLLMAAWSAYAGGMAGFLATLPEYLIGATLSAPLVRILPQEKTAEQAQESEKGAKDMVGTMALSYQNRYTGSLDTLESSLSSIASVIRAYSASHRALTAEEYRNLIVNAAEECCKGCAGYKLCMAEDVRPAIKNADVIAEKLVKGQHISPSDVNTDTEFCQIAEAVANSIRTAASLAEHENHKLKEANSTAEEYELISKLINEARVRDSAEREMNAGLTEALEHIMQKHGLYNGIIRAFGNRRKHFILAAEDESGKTVSSKELRCDIERCASVRLCSPEFFRKGAMALMECGTKPAYAVEFASVGVPVGDGEVSGDSTRCFESTQGYFYSLLSDGMGRGKAAQDTSDFVCGFLCRMLEFSPSFDTVLHLLNHVMRSRGDECSATVDLFELDLYSGEATFIKSGAAPSFVKRDSSIFRIKSQTAPLGLMRSIDTERIKVEIKSEDYVIMLSDGILQCAEDAPWMLELLSAEPKRNLKEYADHILTEAVKHSRTKDDMSVTVLKITKI